MKKLINRVEDVLSEQLAGLAKAHPELTLHQDPVYVTRADAPVAGKVALLSGGTGGKLRPLCDVSVVVGVSETFMVQELHLPVYHALCLMLEYAFFPPAQ